MNGFLVIDKPTGITSRDAVNAIQKWLPKKTKIGHAGTLDPLASGVLVLGIGLATRLTDFVQLMPKTYLSRFRLGVTSDTDDADGTVTETPQAVEATRSQIEAYLEKSVGLISQVPPAYSAARVSGRRAYDLARKGHTVDLSPRTIRIDAITIEAYTWPYLDLRIDCGKGTYIRSIARDLGEHLGCGAMVDVLRRIRIGSYVPEMAYDLATRERIRPEQLLPVTSALETVPKIRLGLDEVRKISLGQPVACSGEIGQALAVLGPQNELVSLGKIEKEGWFQPERVFTAVG